MTSWTHGWIGLFVPYALTTAGVLAGLLFGRAAVERVVIAPLIAIPTFVASALLWNRFIEIFARRIAQPDAIGESYLLELFAFSFFLSLGTLAGCIAANLALGTNHTTGSILERIRRLAQYAKFRMPHARWPSRQSRP